LNIINHRKQSIKLCVCICSCIPAFLHVENVGQDLVVAEVEAEEAEAQEEQQLQESNVAEEDQVTTTDLANPNLQQGKHQINSTSVLHTFKFMQFIYACALKLVGFD